MTSLIDWRPIETAPKLEDEDTVLGYDRRHGVVAMYWKTHWYGREDGATWLVAYNDEEYGQPLNPTHWAPLPEPPDA